MTGGFPRNAGRHAYAKRVADAAAAAAEAEAKALALAEAEAAALAVVAAAAVEAAAAAAAVQRPLRVEDIPFVAPRGTPAAIHAPQDGEDSGYTPEVVEEDAPVRTSPLAPPARPTPTFISDPVPVTAMRPSSPAPVRPVAGLPRRAHRPGFLPRPAATTPDADVPAPAADAAAPRTGFSGLPRRAPTEPVQAEPAPAPKSGFKFKNGTHLTVDDIPF